MKKYLVIVIIMMFGLQTMFADNTYDLKFDIVGTPGGVGGNVYLKLSIKSNDASDSDFGLGSCNIRFNYNNAAINNPTLDAALAFNSGSYLAMGISVSSDQLSVNIVKIGMGFPIGPAGELVEIGVWKEFAIIKFDVVSTSIDPALTWRTPSDFPNTTIYQDDQATFLMPGLLNTGPGPLPIDLMAFDADWKSQSKTEALVSWTVASQINNAFYTIEKSMNNGDWEELEIIQGEGTYNNVKSYSIIDKAPYDNITYYRLKQTDFDGQTEMFDPEYIKKDGSFNGMKIYPNPADEYAYIEVYSEENVIANIIINNLNGKTLVNKKEELNEGLNQIKIYVGNLEAASYLIRLQSENMVNYKMLIKQ